MAVVTFKAVQEYLSGSGVLRDNVVQCVADLRLEDEIAYRLDAPTLQELYVASRESELAGTQGALILGVLRAGKVDDITKWCSLVAPEMKLPRRRALDLHADCWLALGEWVTLWNRRRIRIAS